MYSQTLQSSWTIVKGNIRIILVDLEANPRENGQLHWTILGTKQDIMSHKGRHAAINVSEVARATGLSRSTIYHALDDPSKARPRTLLVLKQAGLELAPQTALIIPPAVREFALAESLTLREVERLLKIRMKPVETMTTDELMHVWKSASPFPDLYFGDEIE